MTLTPLADLSAADWFVEAEAEWWTKVCLGPPGYEAYVRLQLVPLDEESEIDLAQLTVDAIRPVLGRHTSMTHSCFFGQWDGSGRESPVPPVRQTFPNRPVARRILAEREYHLFSGALDDLGRWDGGDPPHLMWPADRAWFMAKDVDPDWMAVGGTQALIDELLAVEGLDATPSPYASRDGEDR